MKKLLYLFILCLSLQIHASETTPPNPPRINQLFPKFMLKIPAIEPAIPSNYILYPEENYGMVYWGTPEDLDLFYADLPTNAPIFGMFYSGDTYQTGPNSFYRERYFKNLLKRQGFRKINMQKLKWGQYPVLALDYLSPERMHMRMAYVGLNDEGAVMTFGIMPPKTIEQEKKAANLWNHFLQNTKELKEPELFQALGMDMSDGYTIYTFGTTSVKVFAEKRRSDNLLAIMVEPLKPNTTFEINEVFECWMGTNWKYGEPCTKVDGVISEIDENMKNYIDCVITVLTKEVDEFSFDIDEKSNFNSVVYTMKSEEEYSQIQRR